MDIEKRTTKKTIEVTEVACVFTNEEMRMLMEALHKFIKDLEGSKSVRHVDWVDVFIDSKIARFKTLLEGVEKAFDEKEMTRRKEIESKYD